MAPRKLKEKKGANPLLFLSSMASVDASLVSNPLSLPPSLCRAGSQLRLLLSV